MDIYQTLHLGAHLAAAGELERFDPLPFYPET